MSDSDRPSAPLWWYAIVAVAALIAVLWFVRVIVGILLGLLTIAVMLILCAAVVAWAVGRKADR